MPRLTEKQVDELPRVGPFSPIAINLNYVTQPDGPPIGLFGIVTDTNELHEFVITEQHVHIMMASLENYLALVKGKPLPHPTRMLD